jgi:nicotinamidase-related amidase
MAGPEDLQLPDGLREGVQRHLKELGDAFRKRGWAQRMGFGKHPAVIVIDLAKGWTDSGQWLGSDLDSVVENTREVLEVARRGKIPIFFTVQAYGPDDPLAPWDKKYPGTRTALALGSKATELDPRLERRPDEKLIVKKYPSCFKGTDLRDMLHGLGIDTLIVTGCSTMHCVYATCRDASSSFHVIVPREAVGDRCELFHLVALLDIDTGMGDVVSNNEVIAYLAKRGNDPTAEAAGTMNRSVSYEEGT